MVKKAFRLLLAALGGLLGFGLIYLLFSTDVLVIASQGVRVAVYAGVIVLFALLTFIFAHNIIAPFKKLVVYAEQELQKLPFMQVVMGGIGLILGLLLASLIAQPIENVLAGVPVIGSILGVIVTVGFYVALGYLGLMLASSKRNELVSAFSRQRSPERVRGNKRGGVIKILDTSVLIDGRVAGIIDAGFLDGELAVPAFVLKELQHIADSQDSLRRQKGRRGLDIVKQIQASDHCTVSIPEESYESIVEVDSKLIEMAKDRGGKVVTTDYNLNKLASVHGVPVLNINDLANAMRPIVIPGEDMVVTVMKDGKEVNQGLAYLDDGTMIVVENGKRHIGDTIPVVVTSILQTSAGKMIFARPK